MRKSSIPKSKNLRKEAEELLSKNVERSIAQLSEPEIYKLLRELEVQQLELKLKNEELIRTKKQADAATEKYTELYDFAPLGYFTLSDSGKILELNLSAAQMLGLERSHLRNKLFSAFVSPKSNPIFNLFFEKALGSKTKQTCEIALVNVDNTSVIVNLAGIVPKNQNHCLITAIDVTDEKLSEAIFMDIIEKNPMSIQILDMEGFVLQANLAYTKLFGVQPPSGYSVLKDPQLLNQGFGELFEQIKRGEVVFFPDSYYNVHDVDPSFPDSPVWVKAVGFTLNDHNGSPERIVLMHENITERKHAEALLNDIIEKNPLSIQIVDKDGYTLHGNPAYSKLFGAIPPPDFSIFDDLQNKSEELKQLIKLAKNGEIVYLPDIYFNPHDEVSEAPDIPLWIRAMIFPLNDSRGKSERFVLIHENITERKKAEIDLREHEVQYRNLANSGLSLIWTSGADKLCNYFNETWLTFTGRTLAQELGNGWVEGVHPDDVDQCFDTYVQAFNRRESFEMEYRLMHSSGEYRWILDLGTPNYNSSGDFIGYIGNCFDITDRKKAEQELITAKQIAEENEVKYRQIFDNTFDIMAIYEVTEDMRFKVVTFNAAEEKLIGPVEYFQNRYIDECIPPDLYNQFRLNYEHCIEAEELIIYEEDILFGEIDKTFHTQLIPLKNSAGRIHRIIVISRDITENKRLQTQLIKQNEELKRLNIDLKYSKEQAEESDRLKSAFLANMSHEIRTPMNGILGFAELLKEADLTSEQQQYYVNIIEKSGARMLNIINDIINISKIESGQMNVKISETSVNELVENIYIFFKPEVEGKGLQLLVRNSLPVKEAIINSDWEKIYAILTNLVKNAIKFTKTGSIELGYEKDNGYLRFFVKDTGIGIRPDHLDLVFERFRQADELLTRDYEGSGLGLSISKAYVEMLGGKIWVESKFRNSSEIDEGGSIFYFTLPYITPSQSKSSDVQSDSSKTKSVKIRKLKILIAEDDEGSEIFLTAMLDKYCKEILLTKTGTNAVEICRNNPDLDLILMDIKMREMDGYQATTLIRQFNKDVIIIAQTAFAQNGVKELAINAGCNDYLSKPIQRNELFELLHQYFGN